MRARGKIGIRKMKFIEIYMSFSDRLMARLAQQQDVTTVDALALLIGYVFLAYFKRRFEGQ